MALTPHKLNEDPVAPESAGENGRSKAVPTTEPRFLQLLLWAVGIFLAYRGALFVLDFFGVNLTNRMGRCRKHWAMFGEGHYFLNGFFRWDAGWYRTIALEGYSFNPNRGSAVAFYPLYPYLCRYLGYAVGSPFAAALIVSNTATLGVLIYVRKLGAHFFGHQSGKLAATLLLLFPGSFFLSAFYTEALFLTFACGSMFYYFKEKYLWCGLLGLLAMLTRSTGLVLFGALSLDLLVQLIRRDRRFEPRMLSLLLIPLGLGLFMAILQVQVGDPLAFSKTMHHWGRYPSWPWNSLWDALSAIKWNFPKSDQNVQKLLDCLWAIGFLGMGGTMIWRRYPVALWSFVLAGVLLPLGTHNLASMNRYVFSLFPAFLLMAEVCRKYPALERPLLVSSGSMLAVYSLRFMECGWAG